ncbi:hypothetical protein NQT69_02420 [Pseudoalteromonas shioyasakiensis]|uniref:hypothetical protein n=1 Tax=Pseudoalteromonas shioyasakiensis TaxID=1190813 RepID=UPI00211834D3|nr:hypothetical protein [Pseudoalteromonas shioyasakiensis]MCQ8876888.1 hypothetical protein [Pseudoalteromonas shioyasakiensis]
MNNNNSIETASNAVRKMWETHGIKKPMRFLGFCLSLLPIPGIQQAGSALDRHLSDKAFEAQLEALWAEISAANEMVSKVDSLEKAIQEIAKTIESSPELEVKTTQFISSLGNAQKEFSVLTENQSYQELRSSIIHADISAFVATGGSTNVIQNSTVNSEKTHLHATDNSKNYVDGTTFQGGGGAVSMQGITTQGAVSVQESGIGFGAGGSISFGGNPNQVSGNCPNCNELLRLDKRELANYKRAQCHKCNGVFPYKL